MLEQPRRYLLAVGVEHYMDHKKWPRLEQVPSEIEQVVELLTDATFGMTRILEETSATPGIEDLLTKLGAWAASPDRLETDQLILYWSGHGENIAESLKLVLENTSSQALSPVITAQDLIERSLGGNSRIDAALFILDTCFSGQGGLNMFDRIGPITRARPRSRAPAAAFISASSSRSRAKQGAFAKAFVEALPLCACQRYLSLENIRDEINCRMPAGQQVTLTLHSGKATFFHHIPEVELFRRQARLRAECLAAVRRDVAREQYGSEARITCQGILEREFVVCQLALVGSGNGELHEKSIYVCSNLFAEGRALDLQAVSTMEGRVNKLWRLPRKSEVASLVDPDGVCSAGANHPFDLTFPLDALFWVVDGAELIMVNHRGETCKEVTALCILVYCG